MATSATQYTGIVALGEPADLYFELYAASVLQTGKTVTVTLCKNGGAAYAACGAVVSEIGNGTYRIQLKAPDTSSLGFNKIRAVAAACDDSFVGFTVVNPGVLDPVLAIDNALSNAGLKHLSEEVRRLAARVQAGRWKPNYSE